MFAGFLKIVVALAFFCTFTACEQAKDSADKTARDLTGSNLVQQEKALKEKLNAIQEAEQQRLQQIE